MLLGYGGAVLLLAVWCVHVSRAIQRTLTVIVQCICQQLRTILYRDIKQWQLCEIQFAWSLNPVWHNRQGMHVLKPTEIKELSRILWRENCSGPRLQPHRRNTPSARVPLLTARSVGSIYLFAQFPTPARVLLSRGLSGGSSKPPTHCSRQPWSHLW